MDAPISKLSQDPTVGRDFDKRFARDEINVEGVQFNGPKTEQPTYEIGRRSAELLLTARSQPARPRQEVLLHPHLIVREST